MRRFGLRGRMALSYVLVTAAAVLLVEGLILVVFLGPTLTSADTGGHLQDRAASDAKLLSLTVTKAAALDQSIPPRELLSQAMRPGGGPIELGPEASGKLALTPDKSTAEPVETVLDATGQVIASSAPGLYPAGTTADVPIPGSNGGAGKNLTRSGEIVWWMSPVLLQRLRNQAPETIGYVFTQAQVDFRFDTDVPDLGPLLAPGGLVLALAVPVGLVFGLLTTRRLSRRVRALADVTTAVADGDFRPQVPVSGRDEVGQLEDSFNRMTQRLGMAVEAARLAARAEARQAERGRIARELHDSISQDLFSLSLLAAGMRRAAPAGLREAADSMERTSARAMHEMQALLLELRPVALEHAGLTPALQELCHAYETRLGVRVTTCLEPVPLAPAAEHAVLRLVQEALGNAVKHAAPTRLEVRLARTDDVVTVRVSDDGPGFDPEAAGARHGMGLSLMRERVHELGGYLEISVAGGTTITATFPWTPS